MASDGGSRAEGGQLLKQLVQNLRSDLNLLSTEARKKYPAVREAAERGAMKLKSMSESKGFSLQVLAATDDVVHPLLFACETKNLRIAQISLAALQRLIQYKAVPQKSVESIASTLRVLMDSCVEELKILQTILLLVTATDIVQGKSLGKILVLCFKMYRSSDTSVHNTAGVAIRQIVSTMFDRLSALMSGGGDGGGVSASGREKGEGKKEDQQLPTQAKDAYLLFQDICLLTNGDPPAWLPGSLEMELNLGLELLETVLKGYPSIFHQETLFNLLLTERVCPLVIKLFSPTSKYRHSHSPHTGPLVPSDKPTFALSIRLLRILSVLIREFYVCLITQCEIFLSMLVKFLDSDKPLWQRTLAAEVLHSFCNHPLLLRSFCESYDMQEHSSKIFGDIIDALGAFIHSNFTLTSPMVQLPFNISSSGVAGGNSMGHVTPSGPSSSRQMHLFTVRSTTIHVESLSPSAFTKPTFLDMLDKTEVPVIPEGYSLVVAMNALLDAIRSVSLVINDEVNSATTPTQPPDTAPQPAVKGTPAAVKEVMLKSSWSGVLAALALLLDGCADEHTTGMILAGHQTFIQLCGKLSLTTPRDAFLTSLCKASLPPRYAMGLITQRGSKPSGLQRADSSEKGLEADTSSHGRHGGQASLSDAQKKAAELGSARKKLNFTEGGAGGASGGGGGEVGGGKGGTPTLHRGGGSVGSGTQPREQQSGYLTVKNLQCVSTLLKIIDRHGDILDTAWALVITAVQHIVDVFGLKPAAMGSFQPIRITENSAMTLVSVVKKTEISEITDKLTNLFKSMQHLSDNGLLHLINGLCQLSSDAMQGPAARESTVFPLASLLETGSTNLARVKLVWGPVTSHLTQVCSHSDQGVRAFGADALTSLIRTALEQKYEEDLQPLLLSPLEAMTAVQHTDVRQKQLECVSHVLHSSGQTLSSSWSVLLDVISSAARTLSEALVRAGFQSLQLVITDFLPAVPPVCLPVCVEVAGQFSVQAVEINISLTSIGLLWNIADYLYQNRATLQDGLETLRNDKTGQAGYAGLLSPTSPTRPMVSSFMKSVQSSSLPVFNSVWMLLFRHLSDLCVDARAAVRKSASQTLFSTISAHGVLLQREAWQSVLWQVLFPLLERVNQAAGSASTSSFQTSLLIHHSRDTAQKQWAETQVLTLNGTARLFQARWSLLASLQGFERAWTTLLEAIKSCACSHSSEVSIAAMKSFHSIVDPQGAAKTSPRSSPANLDAMPTEQRSHDRSPDPAVTLEPPGGVSQEQNAAIWTKAWQTWHSIGIECVCNRLPTAEQLKSVLKQKQEVVSAFFDSLPSQSLLVHLLKIFPLVFSQLKPSFSRKDFQSMTRVFEASLLMPVVKDVSPFLVPSSNENLMTVVQKLVLKCFGAIFTEESLFPGEGPGPQGETSLLLDKRSEDYDMKRVIRISAERDLVVLYVHVLEELLKYVSYVSNPPGVVKLVAPPGGSQSLQRVPTMTVNYVPFGLVSLAVAVQLYRACVAAGVDLPLTVPEKFLKALHLSLKQKYRCPRPLVWSLSLEAMLLVLETALPSMLQQDKSSVPFWSEFAGVLEDCLFNQLPEGLELSVEKMREHEAMDIKVIEVIKRDILPVSTSAPRPFLERLTAILNQGSIHSATDQFNGNSRSPKAPFRENFARACFEALLQLSFIHSKETNIDATSQLALNALLDRSQEVLIKFVEDERLSGTCPLPRARMNEVALVLKSVTVLISTLKEAQRNTSAQVDRTIWQHVSRLHPALVQCITCSSTEVRTALKEALAQFSDLINP